jgi:3',5'-nucleoside bisphosphate phosphatase
MIAAEMVKAGHVASIDQAFEEYLGDGRPAYVPRIGATPCEVVEIIALAGGISSLAHPGVLSRDDLIPALSCAGLTALEAYHSDHDADTVQHYVRLARRHGLAVTGGSDYHGDPELRAAALGTVFLPSAEFEKLERIATARGANSSPL